MPRCLISFGANIGDAQGSVLAADQLLRQLLRSGDRVELSRLYRTPPVGGPSGQPPFVNAVASVETQLDPWEVWHVIRSIEEKLGRERIRRWEARRIDLDILLYDDRRIWTPQLKIPHPRMCMRRFILQPAADVASDWLDPVSLMTIGELAAQLSSGPGSLILASPPELERDIILQRTAQSGVQQVSADELLRPNNNRTQNLSNEPRQIALCDTQRLSARLGEPFRLSQCAAKLAVFWEGAMESSAWEDQHRHLADRLRLTEPNPSRSFDPPLPLVGPRYLLATSDVGWAAHEVLAAFDAMDCHVEPFT